jgi:hypothetical protein
MSSSQLLYFATRQIFTARQILTARNVWFARVALHSQSLQNRVAVNGMNPEYLEFRRYSVGLGDE